MIRLNNLKLLRIVNLHLIVLRLINLHLNLTARGIKSNKSQLKFIIRKRKRLNTKLESSRRARRIMIRRKLTLTTRCRGT